MLRQLIRKGLMVLPPKSPALQCFNLLSFAVSPSGFNHQPSDLSLSKGPKSKSPLLISPPSSVLKLTSCIEVQFVSFPFVRAFIFDSTGRHSDMMLLDKLASTITMKGLLCCLVQGLNLLQHLFWLSCRHLGGIC